MGAQVSMGNVSPIDYITDPETGEKSLHRWQGITRTETTMNLVEPALFEQMRDALTFWRNMSDQPPAWIEGDDENLVAALRQHFGVGERPDDWEADIVDPVLVKVEPDEQTVTTDDVADTAEVLA